METALWIFVRKDVANMMLHGRIAGDPDASSKSMTSHRVHSRNPEMPRKLEFILAKQPARHDDVNLATTMLR